MARSTRRTKICFLMSLVATAIWYSTREGTTTDIDLLMTGPSAKFDNGKLVIDSSHAACFTHSFPKFKVWPPLVGQGSSLRQSKSYFQKIKGLGETVACCREASFGVTCSSSRSDQYGRRNFIDRYAMNVTHLFQPTPHLEEQGCSGNEERIAVVIPELDGEVNTFFKFLPAMIQGLLYVEHNLNNAARFIVVGKYGGTLVEQMYASLDFSPISINELTGLSSVCIVRPVSVPFFHPALIRRAVKLLAPATENIKAQYSKVDANLLIWMIARSDKQLIETLKKKILSTFKISEESLVFLDISMYDRPRGLDDLRELMQHARIVIGAADQLSLSFFSSSASSVIEIVSDPEKVSVPQLQWLYSNAKNQRYLQLFSNKRAELYHSQLLTVKNEYQPSNQAVFEEIYQYKFWGKSGRGSGAGSNPEYTKGAMFFCLDCFSNY